MCEEIKKFILDTKNEIIKKILSYEYDMISYNLIEDFIKLDKSYYNLNGDIISNKTKLYNDLSTKIFIDPTKTNIFLRYLDIYPLIEPVKIYDNIVYNANSIKSDVDDFNYYASQCPVNDFKNYDICFFLKMLIDNDIKLVCIPSSFDNPSKMFRWFPITPENFIFKQKDLDLEYELKYLSSNKIISKIKKDEIIYIYDIEILDKKINNKHIIKIFNYVGWPDGHIPEDKDLLLTYIFKIFKYIKDFNLNNILTHCSAGIGRTGTVLCCVELLKYINNYIFDFDKKEFKNSYSLKDKNIIIKQLYVSLINFIYKLRLYRPYMVQSNSQFNEINQFIINIINKYIDVNFDYSLLLEPPLKRQSFN